MEFYHSGLVLVIHVFKGSVRQINFPAFPERMLWSEDSSLLPDSSEPEAFPAPLPVAFLVTTSMAPPSVAKLPLDTQLRI